MTAPSAKRSLSAAEAQTVVSGGKCGAKGETHWHTPLRLAHVQGALGAISYVRGLRVLRIEDLHCRLETEAVMDLGALAQVGQPPHSISR